MAQSDRRNGSHCDSGININRAVLNKTEVVSCLDRVWCLDDVSEAGLHSSSCRCMMGDAGAIVLKRFDRAPSHVSFPGNRTN